MMKRFALALLMTAAASVLAQQETKLLHGFEDDGELKKWEFKKGSGNLSDQHVTQGAKSLKIDAGEYMLCFSLPRDWSGFDSLDIDMFVDGPENVGIGLLVADEAWNTSGKAYWDRHNGGHNLKPGANTISISVNGLYRGEAGSRNNHLKTNIDPKSIIRMDMGFNAKSGSIYIDNMRLVKESRPAGIMAYDFGPPSQTVFPGFTPITWNTVFGQGGAKAGLRRAAGGAGQARDDTFPTRLYQDFVEMNGNEFVAEAPTGKYQAFVVFDDCGYWGGENSHHSRRSISNNGKEVWIDDRGENGPVDYLFRFENIEPHPGDSIWDLYMKDLFKPARFSVESVNNEISLTVKADAGWSCKVAAVILYPEAQKAEAEKWVAEVEDRNRKEFENRAVFMGPKPQDLKAPADAATKGYWIGFPTLEQDVSFTDAPGAADGKLSRAAAKGQRISFTFAIRPTKDLGDVKLVSSELKGPGAIPASAVDLRYVHHAVRRGFNDIAYSIIPESLRPLAGSNLKLAKDLTRQFWITVAVPEDAKPGAYSGTLSLTAGGAQVQVPYSVDVIDVKLDEPDFPFGFYGTWVPGEYKGEKHAAAVKQLLTLIKECGMNSMTGGPNIPFKGFDDKGAPILEFGPCDAWFKLLKEAGFTKEIQAYGGPGMVDGLHDGYVIGDTGRNWAKKTGKPFGEVLKIVWTAVKEHGEKEGWPTIAYGFTDEPRTVESAQEQVELMKAYREAIPWFRIGGSYSVHWADDPLGKAIQDIFKTLVWSGLNLHTQKDMDMAKEWGRQVYIYNQGTTRFSFGAYQWAEMSKGVKARMQWHLLALHGYQYFDLDGREPDFAMINWGKSQIYPTIHFHRCREGADDFRYAVTVKNLADKKKDSPEGKAALAFLEQINKQVPIGKSLAPKDFMGDEAFRLACIEHIKKLK